MTTDTELDELLEEARLALVAPPHERVHRTLVVVPKLVNALDRAATARLQLRTARAQLTFTVRRMREQVWAAQRLHPEVTFDAGRIHRTMVSLAAQLDQLAQLLAGGQDDDLGT